MSLNKTNYGGDISIGRAWAQTKPPCKSHALGLCITLFTLAMPSAINPYIQFNLEICKIGSTIGFFAERFQRE